MDFEISTASLKEAISAIFDIVSQKMSDGADMFLKIEACADNMVKFTAHDSLVRAMFASSASVVEAGSVVANLPSLYKAVSGFPTNNKVSGEPVSVRLRRSGHGLLLTSTVKYGNKNVKQKRTVPLCDGSVPYISVMDDPTFISLDVDVFLDTLKRTLFSMSNDLSSYGGLNLFLSRDKIRFSSTNGVCLTESTCFVDLPSVGENGVVVRLSPVFSTKLVKVISYLRKSYECQNIDLALHGSTIAFLYVDFTVFSSVCDSGFPNYEALLEEIRRPVLLNTGIVLDNIRNLKYSSDKEDDFRVSLKFCGNDLVISTALCENEGIPIEGDSEVNLHIDFNINLLEQCFSNVDSEYVTLSYKDSHSPVIISPQSAGDKYTLFSILAPLR